MSTEEESKAVVRRYVDAFNRGDLNALKALLADDAEIQGVMGKGVIDKAGFIAYAPVGSIKKGEALVTTGGAGADLRGVRRIYAWMDERAAGAKK